MFAYCDNNPVMYEDPNGDDPVEVIDSDGDGEADCVVYEYSYEASPRYISFYIVVEPSYRKGRLFIYRGIDEETLSSKKEQIVGFVDRQDFVIGDFTNQNNPNIQVRDSYKCTNEAQMKAIADTLLEYGRDYAPQWKRTKDSLVTEWKCHNDYALFSERARHVDFDVAEENKGGWYFFTKAIKNAFEMIF